MKKTQIGFTLIELMIVVAIISILAAIAIPSYDNYIREARMAKVAHHYDEAYRAVKAEMLKISAILARNGNLATEWEPRYGGSINDIDAWFNVLNPQNRSAPEGGVPAYSDTADPTNGVVHLSVDNVPGGTFRVVVERPAYLELSSASVSVSYSNL